DFVEGVEARPVGRVAKNEAQVASRGPRCEDSFYRGPGVGERFPGMLPVMLHKPVQFVVAHQGLPDVIGDHVAIDVAPEPLQELLSCCHGFSWWCDTNRQFFKVGIFQLSASYSFNRESFSAAFSRRGNATSSAFFRSKRDILKLMLTAARVASCRPLTAADSPQTPSSISCRTRHQPVLPARAISAINTSMSVLVRLVSLRRCDAARIALASCAARPARSTPPLAGAVA